MHFVVGYDSIDKILNDNLKKILRNNLKGKRSQDLESSYEATVEELGKSK